MRGLDLKKETDYAQWIESVKKRTQETPALDKFNRFIISTIESKKPSFKRGMPYFVVENFPEGHRDLPVLVCFGAVFAKSP